MRNVFKKRKGISCLALSGLLLISPLSLSSCGEGKDGKDGATWYQGAETDPSQGKIGDFFFDTDDMAIYTKTESGWELVGAIKGKDGEKGQDGANGKDGNNGKDGTVWFGGNEIEGTNDNITAAIEGAKIGDFYLNSETGNIYKCVGENTWAYVMCLKQEESKQDWKEDNTLKILSIGNSFSVDSQQWLYQIAESLGVKHVVLGNLYVGGCSLWTHLNNLKNSTAAYTYYTNDTGNWEETANYQIVDAVSSENWDYITFQQASGESGIASTYGDLDAILDIVSPLCPKAKLLWNMTWAYQSNSTHVDFAKYNKDQTTMYKGIIDAVQTKIETNDRIEGIIPVGTAVQNARTSYLGDNLTRDGFHLTYNLGRYIAGLCFACSATGLSLDDIAYAPEGVTEGEKKVALESVKNAFLNPYQVTDSAYKEDPSQIDLSDYDRVSISWSKSSFYNSDQNHQNLITDDSLCPRFWASQIFSKEDLPVGSVIEVSSPWQYRPEGWVNGKSSGSRPANVALATVVIDSSWWGSYDQRAFNVSKTTSDDVSSLADDDLNSVFKIYTPKETAGE